MCPSEFGRLGGIIFIALGALGFAQLLGPTAAESILGPFWWLDPWETAFYLSLGAILFASSLASPAHERPVLLLTGWLLVVLSFSALFSDTLILVHVERPVQPIFYLVMGVWGIVSAFCSETNETQKETSVLG